MGSAMSLREDFDGFVCGGWHARQKMPRKRGAC
jgi:hypothetical protein